MNRFPVTWATPDEGISTPNVSCLDGEFFLSPIPFLLQLPLCPDFSDDDDIFEEPIVVENDPSPVSVEVEEEQPEREEEHDTGAFFFLTVTTRRGTEVRVKRSKRIAALQLKS